MMKTTVPIQVFKLVCLWLAFYVLRVENTLSCDFEEANISISICNYTEGTSPYLDWTRCSGPFPCLKTGSDTDNTFACMVGNCVNIEATKQNNSEVARLVTSVYTLSANAECIDFWYQMHGDDNNTLLTEFQRSGLHGSIVFQDNQGRIWTPNFSIPENSQPFQLVVEGRKGVPGDNYHYDINVTQRHCNVIPGSISRQCSTDGKWKPPLYACIRASITEVLVKDQTALDAAALDNLPLEKLKNNTSSAGLSSVLDDLVNITSVSEEKDSVLFPGELEKVTIALNDIATLVKSGVPPTEEQSRSFLNTASNLLNEENRKSWSSLSQSKGDSGATKLLQSIDTFSGAITMGMYETNTSKVTIIQSNIFLEARKVNASQQEIIFPLPSTSPDLKPIDGVKFSLPLGNSSEKTPKKYTVVVYKNLAGILPNTVYSTQSNKTNEQYELNTRVLSLQVFPNETLCKPLEMAFDLQNPNFHEAICSYWNFQEKRWNSDGCRVKRLLKSSVICECCHLTNFAALMSPWQETSVESTAIEIISIVGCSISIFCLIATTLLHILLWRHLKNDRAVVLINICAALTATYIIFLAGNNRTGNQDACSAVAALFHYILLVVFCLMLAEGIEIIITVKYVFIMKSRIKWMIPLSWGIPAVVVGISLGATRLNGYGTKSFCWLSVENGVIWAFVGPAMLIISVNIIFLGIVLRTMLKTKAYTDMSEVDRIKDSTRCLCVLVPLMGCTWVLGIFYVNDRTTWIQYVFAICNSLQGFFIFLFHGVLNKKLQTALKYRYKKYKESRLPSKHTDSVNKSSGMKRPEVTGAMNPVFNISSNPDFGEESNQVPDNDRKSLSSDEAIHSPPARIINIAWKN